MRVQVQAGLLQRHLDSNFVCVLFVIAGSAFDKPSGRRLGPQFLGSWRGCEVVYGSTSVSSHIVRIPLRKGPSVGDPVGTACSFMCVAAAWGPQTSSMAWGKCLSSDVAAVGDEAGAEAGRGNAGRLHSPATGAQRSPCAERQVVRALSLACRRRPLSFVAPARPASSHRSTRQCHVCRLHRLSR